MWQDCSYFQTPFFCPIYMSHLADPPTQTTPEICNASPVGTWRGPPHCDIQPYVTRFQLPRRCIGPSLPLQQLFLLWKVAPGSPNRWGLVGTKHPSPLTQAELRTSAHSVPDRLICPKGPERGVRVQRWPRVATSNAHMGQWGMTQCVEIWSWPLGGQSCSG